MAEIMILMTPHRQSCRLIPLYYALQKLGYTATLSTPTIPDTIVDEVLALLELNPTLEIPYNKRALLTDSILNTCNNIIESHKPSLIITEGYSPLTIAAALAASYKNIPIAHLASATAEPHHEMHRGFMRLMASWHITATQAAAAQLLAHGIRREAVWCIGNMLTDLLSMMREKIESERTALAPSLAEFITSVMYQHARWLLVATSGLGDAERAIIFQALRALLAFDRTLCIVVADQPETELPFHHERLFTCHAKTYPETLALLMVCHNVLTNIPYLLEDAICLDKPVIYTEKINEIEAIWAELACPTRINEQEIVDAYRHLMQAYIPGKASLLYGHGQAADKAAQNIVMALSRIQHKIRVDEYLGVL